MSRPLFLTPLRLEARAVRRGAPEAEIVQIGMGPVRATAARARVTAAHEAGRPILLLGFGGALASSLAPGDLVVATSLGSIDTDERVELPAGEEAAATLEAAGISARLAPIVSSAVLVRGLEARQRAAASGAAVVDMESLWCAPLVRRHRFAVVRAVVDVPGAEVRSLATPAAAWRAYRSLARAARALAEWSPSTVDERRLQEVGDT
ncbi:MAG TPA: hypothetical protein VKV23_04130 [Acidimicrobiales bacterium]|nr:hypothetical protein [Acidimicrobiales bacterium]